MFVRIDASAPREAIKMALDFAAQNDLGVDFRVFGTVKSQNAEVKPSPKAVPVKPKAVRQPKARNLAESDALRVAARSLREKAESGDVKLPKAVYAALRSKDLSQVQKAVEMATAIFAATPKASPKPKRKTARRPKDFTPFKDIYGFELHERFLHENPLLDA